jgi:TctA family transporter
MLIGITLGVADRRAAGAWAAPTAVRILLPLTFSMNPTSAIIML